MTSPAIWMLGLAGSIAAHAGAAALVAVTMDPRPTPDQPPPQSELRIETQDVTRSKAIPEPPRDTPANPASAKGTTANPGQVPASKAAALPPKAEALAAAPPKTPATPPDTAPAQKLTANAPPAATKAVPPPQTALKPAAATPAAAQTLAASAPRQAALPATTIAAKVTAATPAPALTLATSAPRQAALTATTISAQVTAATPAPALTLAATAAPAPTLTAAPPVATTRPTEAPATPLAPTPDTGTALTSAAPDTPQAAQAVPDLQPAAAAPAEGTRMTAELAWTGDQAQIDPASLTAIQSFMQPGDASARTDQTHDALSAILTSVPCSRLQAEFNPATGSLDLRGHVPDPALKGPILQALQAQLGTGITVNDAMLILPRPQCGALSGIADVGLPQSQDQNTNPRLIGADAQARAYDYTRGQTLILDLAAPDYDAYVYVDYFAADGTVIHLIPNDTVPLKLRPAQSTLRVGAPDANEPFLNLTIGPPYGQEIATAFAASAPLYDGTRPLTEPAAAYLDWLKTRVTEARAKDPGFKGEWVYFFVSTKD